MIQEIYDVERHNENIALLEKTYVFPYVTLSWGLFIVRKCTFLCAQKITRQYLYEKAIGRRYAYEN